MKERIEGVITSWRRGVVVVVHAEVPDGERHAVGEDFVEGVFAGGEAIRRGKRFAHREPGRRPALQEPGVALLFHRSLKFMRI